MAKKPPPKRKAPKKEPVVQGEVPRTQFYDGCTKTKKSGVKSDA